MKSIFAFSVITFLSVTNAFAHIGFGNDYECDDSYEKSCFLQFNSQRVARLFFRGTPAELGENCDGQTLKLGQQILAAEKLLGLNRGDLKYSAPHVRFEGENRVAKRLECAYVVWSDRKDLRFSLEKLNSRWWTNAEEQAGICMDDVRKAEAIPGSIGAGRGMSGSLTQGEMCASQYLMPGLDRIGEDLNGNPKIIKYGTREYSQPDQTKSQSRPRTEYQP
ncbi:MAG: hypothetical protein J0L82_07815 [Deltaproteobacteria bacterium]|nr:hypothetical protein [Deltaproteobacteria bacterium]